MIRMWCCSFCPRSDTYSNGNRRTALHDDVTYVIFFFEYLKFCMFFCLSLSSHYGFKSSSGRIQFVQKNLLYKRYHTTAGFKSVSQYTAQQRVAGVNKFSKFSESIFDSLQASGISW